MNTFTINLEACEFYAYHGIYQQEREQGNTFLVDIAVEIDSSIFEKTHDLGSSIDYEKLYQIAKVRMSVPTPLLESIAVWMADDIAVLYANANSIQIKISKNKPPIGGACRNSKVVFKKILLVG